MLYSQFRTSTYNQKVRLSAMRFIAAKQDPEQIENVKSLLFVKNDEIYRVRYYTNSYHHSLKLRITQAFAFLFRLNSKWDDRMLKIILEEANQPNVTHINEIIIANTINPTQLLQMIANVNNIFDLVFRTRNFYDTHNSFSFILDVFYSNF